LGGPGRAPATDIVNRKNLLTAAAAIDAYFVARAVGFTWGKVTLLVLLIAFVPMIVCSDPITGFGYGGGALMISYVPWRLLCLVRRCRSSSASY
jgi:hypothetical protein